MKKILVIEDNKDISDILKTRLEHQGFSVDTARGGYAVLEYMHGSEMPDAIVLDLVLPERSGEELLASLKSKWQDTKVFIYSGHEKYEGKFKECISGFFLKTNGIDKLINAIMKEIQ